MKKIGLSFGRMILAIGVVIALTPCIFCQSTTIIQQVRMEGCTMHHSQTGSDCCHHGKSQSSFCRTMNQSTVSAAHAPVVSAPAVLSFAVPLYTMEFSSLSVFKSAFNTSPPRTSVLRI
jgi:hypothetical protein